MPVHLTWPPGNVPVACTDNHIDSMQRDRHLKLTRHTAVAPVIAKIFSEYWG